MKSSQHIANKIFARDIRAAAAIIGAIGLLGMGFAVGMTRPMADRTYDLVQFVGDESDIIDYGLSVIDCGTAAARMSAAGLQAHCEVAPK